MSISHEIPVSVPCPESNAARNELRDRLRRVFTMYFLCVLVAVVIKRDYEISKHQSKKVVTCPMLIVHCRELTDRIAGN